MKKILLAVALLFILPPPYASQGSTRAMESISGKTLKVIQSALPEAARNNVDFTKYLILVAESDSSYVVCFDDPERKPGQRGSTNRMLSFEVEIRKETLQVIRSNFIR
jgi:hypothetical protein